jgi:hypothetical protein
MTLASNAAHPFSNAEKAKPSRAASLPIDLRRIEACPSIGDDEAEQTGPFFSPMERLWPSDFRPPSVINSPTLPSRATSMLSKSVED